VTDMPRGAMKRILAESRLAPHPRDT
jgi:hypothetical protein